jgi:hypothetical protein
MHHQHSNPDIDRCIQLCWSCRDSCQSTLFTYCIEKGGHHVQAAHVRLMADCIQICQTSADFMTRNSQLHAVTCAACATVCEACARSCETMGDDAEMRACAQICRDCAQSCREMAEKAGVAVARYA